MTKKQKKMLWRILVSAALLAAAALLDLEGPVRLCAFLLPYAVIGYDVLWRAARNIAHGQVFDENFLMALATIGALFTGEYPEAVFVMLFYQVGELFQSYAVDRSRKSIAALMDIRPDYANLERGGALEQVDPEAVAVGDTIVIKAGERIPLDGVVLEGSSTVNTAALTGEALPREVEPGDDVISGCVNLSGLLRVRVTKEFGASTVAKILDLVENASSKKAKAENFITKFARYYTPVVVIAAVLLAALPPLLGLMPAMKLGLSNLVVMYALLFLNTRTAAELTRLIGSPKLKVLYDVYHMQLNEGSLCDHIRAYADQFGHIHVADAPGRHEPGTGEIYYPAVFAALEQAGYRGLIGYELFPKTDTKTAVRAIMAD